MDRGLSVRIQGLKLELQGELYNAQNNNGAGYVGQPAWFG